MCVASACISFGFRYIILTGLIPLDNARKKLFTFIMVVCQGSSVTRLMLQLMFISQLSQHTPGTQRHLRVSWMMKCADPTLMFNIVATVSTEIRLFSRISASTWATLASLTTVHGRPERCLSTTDVRPSGTLSFHSYSFHYTAESIFCESPSVSLLLTMKILSQNAAPLDKIC
jgi:hypothetical protein